MKASKEFTPYLYLASAIIKQAFHDIDKNNSYAEEAYYFLQSDWGQYLYDTVTSFEKIQSEDLKKYNV